MHFLSKIENDMSDLLDEIEIDFNIYDEAKCEKAIKDASMDALISFMYKSTLVESYYSFRNPRLGKYFFNMSLAMKEVGYEIQTRNEFSQEISDKVANEITQAKFYARLLV